jgi:quinoprotein relay system zinc metallohydrolase 2
MKKILCLLTILTICPCEQVAAQDDSAAVATEIAPGLFVAVGPTAVASEHNQGAISNRAFIIGREAVAVIDTGGSFAAGMALKGAIRQRTKLPIRYVINTHMHPDHVLGNAAFQDEGAIFMGHHKLPRALAARRDQYMQANKGLIGEKAFAGTRIVPPDRLVEAGAEIDLGERKLRLTAHPTAHTDNDLTVFDEATGTLLLGDLVFAEHLPVIDGSLNGWLSVLDALTGWPAARAVPGHGPAQLPWPEGAEPQRRYLLTLRGDLREAVRAGWPLAKALDAVSPDTPEQWGLVEHFHKRNISAAYSELEWE